MKSFNVRVYGLMLNDQNEVLVSDECRGNFSFTKFPGGGLEFGEGLTDALKREFQEELEIEIEVKEQFYVNDFFQVSAFDENHQMISFYFWVSYTNWKEIKTVQNYAPLTAPGQKLRWIAVSELSKDAFNFPIDQVVAQKLIEDSKEK